ncbi:MAG: family 43 glycosylhydrolase [Balneolaceae bacterium]
MKRWVRNFLFCAAALFFITESIYAQERKPGENPIIQDIFTADPAALVYQDTVYLYVGHDEATGDEMFNINEWMVYSSTDMKNWTSHGAIMKPTDFEWSAGNAWASQVIEKWRPVLILFNQNHF